MLNLRLVSKGVSQYVSQEEIWKQLLHKHYPIIYERLLITSPEIKKWKKAYKKTYIEERANRWETAEYYDTNAKGSLSPDALTFIHGMGTYFLPVRTILGNISLPLKIMT